MGRLAMIAILGWAAAAALPAEAAAPAAARRISVAEEGVVRLTGAQLAEWGLRSGPFQVYTDNRGVEFRSADGNLEFYAAPYKGLYARERAFLVANRPLDALSPSGETRPVPAPARRGTPAPPPGSYLEVCHLEEDQFYMSGLPGATPGEEHWFYSTFLLPGGRLQLPAGLDGPLAPGAARLTVALRGATDAAGVDPDHSVAVLLNGVKLGEAVWGGLTRREAAFDVPAGGLREGANTVELQGQALPGVRFDLVCLDWVEISYPRRLAPRGDRLNFSLTTQANQQLAVGGFSERDIVVFDVTDPASPKLLTTTVARKDDGWSVQWIASVAGSKRYAAAGPNGRLAVSSSRAADPWACRSVPRCDYLMVTHADYRASADRLAALHANRGRKVRVFEAEKVYDAFGCGQPVPEAIRELARAVGPQYLCLVGDATGDPRGLTAAPAAGLLPCYFAQGAYFQTASDNLFGCTGADEYPSVAVGRIPARSPAEAEAVIDKTAQRLAALSESPVGERAALVVGDNDQVIFEQGAVELAALLAKRGSVETVLFRDYAGADAIRAAILAGWARRPRHFVYYGHGASTYLGKDQVLGVQHVVSLDAGEEPPAGVILACLAGFYNFSDGSDCLAERLLKEPGRGVCALVAPSGMCAPEGQRVLGREVARALADGRARSLGQALMLAKRRVPADYLEVLRTFNLLGDPAAP